VWLLVDSDDDVPRGTTGKVDVRRLRALLAEQLPGELRSAVEDENSAEGSAG
jgi:hypothetical protein